MAGVIFEDILNMEGMQFPASQQEEVFADTIDLGYFCVDNLPPKLIKTFIELCENTGAEIEKLALVTDIRGDIFSEAFQNSLIN